MVWVMRNAAIVTSLLILGIGMWWTYTGRAGTCGEIHRIPGATLERMGNISSHPTTFTRSDLQTYATISSAFGAAPDFPALLEPSTLSPETVKYLQKVFTPPFGIMDMDAQVSPLSPHFIFSHSSDADRNVPRPLALLPAVAASHSRVAFTTRPITGSDLEDALGPPECGWWDGYAHQDGAHAGYVYHASQLIGTPRHAHLKAYLMRATDNLDGLLLPNTGAAPMVQVWAGGLGTLTQGHVDDHANAFVQIKGNKTFLLTPPSSSLDLHMYPHLHPGALQSQIRLHELGSGDLAPPEDLGLDYFRGLESLAGSVVVSLGPGDVLFVPPQWFHTVVSTTPDSVSISVWSFSHLARPINALMDAPFPLWDSDLYDVDSRLDFAYSLLDTVITSTLLEEQEGPFSSLGSVYHALLVSRYLPLIARDPELASVLDPEDVEPWYYARDQVAQRGAQARHDAGDETELEFEDRRYLANAIAAFEGVEGWGKRLIYVFNYVEHVLFQATRESGVVVPILRALSTAPTSEASATSEASG